MRLFRLLADMAWLRSARDVQRLQRNLSRVTGLAAQSQELRSLTRESMRSYGRYWREMFTLGAWDSAEIERRIRVEGKQFIDAGLADGCGVILAAPHCGNWDLAGVWAAQTYGQATTVAERLKPEALFDAFVAARAKRGIEVLPHKGGARPAFAVLLERLRAGGLVGLVSDRDLSSTGVEVEFFGATARMAAGPAALALRTHAHLHPIYIWNDGEAVVFEVQPEIVPLEHETVQAVTQRLADRFAASIASHPTDWHMLQRVWPESEHS